MKYGITINTNFLIHCLHDCLYVINPSKTKHLSSVKIKLMINIKCLQNTVKLYCY